MNIEFIQKIKETLAKGGSKLLGHRCQVGSFRTERGKIEYL